MRHTLFATMFVFMLAGCAAPRIEITRDYIINENWSKKNDVVGGNSIKIEKMKVKKDSIINLVSDLKNEEILSKLEEDSLFRWYANVKIHENSYKNRKIYFSKDNGFTWLDDIEKKRTMVLGNLEKGNWYKFSDLVSYPFYVYLYVDSSNTIYRLDKNLANY